MTIVIDTNSFPCVFDTANEHHTQFAPVKEWIEQRNGFLVFGGKTFKEELIKSYHRARLVRQMKDAGMAIEIKDDLVDRAEAEVREKTAGTTCDDPHIIALLAVSRCHLLCSQDKQSYPFIKDKSNFPKGSKRVRIYTGRRNIKLLTPTKRTDIAHAT